MKLYQDIYIRPAYSRFANLEAVDPNALEGWDRFEMPETSGGFVIDKGVAAPLADGSGEAVFSEKVTFTAGTYKVTADEYAYLCSIYHNKLMDVMLYDTLQRQYVEVCFAMRGSVQLVSDLGDVRVIRLNAEKQYSSSADNPVALFAMTASVIMRGVVTDASTGEPLSDVTVLLTDEDGDREFTDHTDANGEYLILFPAGVLLTWKVSDGGYVTQEVEGESPEYGELVRDFALEGE